MRIPRTASLLVTVTLAAIISVVWLSRRSEREIAQVPPNSTNSEASSPIRPAPTVTEPAHSFARRSSAVASTNSVSRRKSRRDEALDLLGQNDVPILFYGRLLDQFGNGVPDATISGSTIIYNASKAGSEHVETRSDSNGYFQLSAGKGESLGIVPKKQGYVVASGETLFKYSQLEAHPYTPDPNNPTVVKMWKLQGPEPLVDLGAVYNLPYTNGPLFFDLTTKKVVPNGGDLKILVNRPNGEISEQNPQMWTINFEVIDGGFIETTGSAASVTFAAPEAGYRSQTTFTNNNGPCLVEKAFFLQSRNGQIFSKVHLWFSINSGPGDLMRIRVSGVANTNGSRNWEATAPQSH